MDEDQIAVLKWVVLNAQKMEHARVCWKSPAGYLDPISRIGPGPKGEEEPSECAYFVEPGRYVALYNCSYDDFVLQRLEPIDFNKPPLKDIADGIIDLVRERQERGQAALFTALLPTHVDHVIKLAEKVKAGTHKLVHISGGTDSAKIVIEKKE